MPDDVPHELAPRHDLASTHTAEHIQARLNQQPRQSDLRDLVYGAIDGAVTTFAVVSGVAGAGLSPHIVTILGLANLIADGFSMAAGNFLGTRAEDQLLQRARRMEEHHIDEIPEGEREEVRQIFASQGFAGEDLERVVHVITSNRQRWVETMLKEEHGLHLTPRTPWRAAAMTFMAFVIVGAVPLLPFLANLAGASLSQPYFWSALLTAVAFFLVGTAKSFFVDQSWYAAGLETLAVGGAAAGLSYAVGLWLGGK